MGITSRRKRPLDRTIPVLRDARLVFIAAEGEKTEKQYFESTIFRSTRVQVKVLETKNGESSPRHVLRRLREFVRETDLEPDDQLWLMVDTDRWPDEQLAEVCADALRIRGDTRLAISSPCFELWLYLHLDEWTAGPISLCRGIKDAIRSLLGSYNESNLELEHFQDGVADAITRAESMDVDPDSRWPENPGTHVYKVVEAIYELLRGN